MAFSFTGIIKNNYRTAFAIAVVIACFFISLAQSYILFHTIVELFSIIIASAVFIVTWNSRKMMDNHYLYFVGIAYLFIGALDLLHTLTYSGMGIIEGTVFYANQFWVATRFIEAATLVGGFYFLHNIKKPNADRVFLGYFVLSVLVILSIMLWHIFPICYIEGVGQTTFKIFAEYVIILLLLIACYLLYVNKEKFSKHVYRLLLWSLAFTIASEFCFTLYVSNYSLANEYGHYFKLIAFFLIYKANVETGFVHPTSVIFKGLADNEQKYRTLAENLPGPIMRFDVNLSMIYANSSAEKLLHKGNMSSLPLQLHQSVMVALEKAKRNGDSCTEEAVFNEEGVDHYYDILAIPELNAESGDLGFLLICAEVTEQKIAEKELRALNATKDKLFSVIAHDLKNPFTSLLSFSELLYRNADKLSSDKIADMANRMNTSAKQAYVLLDNLLSWSRVQTGLLKPNFSSVSSLSLLTEAVKLALPLAQGKGLTLRIEKDDTIFLQTDTDMIATVLRNLVSNSVKFSHTGNAVLLSAVKLENNVVFSVTDFGVGIKKEHVKHLLGIENKVSQLGTADEKGTGLGLILCREFVELCGGKIWFESVLGVGTTFSFSLPLSSSKFFS